MQIAFIDHIYHQKTRSNRFLIDLLEQQGVVDLWFGEPRSKPTDSWGVGFDEARYDAIVIFQLHEAFDLLSGRHPNVIFIPMYDAMFVGGEFYWKAKFNSAKVVCFSWALRQEVMRRGAVNAGFQYFPDPAQYHIVDNFDTLRGFFWYRRRDIPPSLIFRLCRGAEFERFIVHDAPDPGHESEITWNTPPSHIRNIQHTSWFANAEEYDARLRDANIVFAPRSREGIGMSALEAMASGQCVVAPNAPTMNEYISNGLNGMLYVPGRLSRLDFSAARMIGARARESVERGHKRWLTSIADFVDFVVTPTASSQGNARQLISVRNRFVRDHQPIIKSQPLVSVVTVCRNAATVLEDTMTNVLGQIGCNFEYIVIDGNSTDGSVDIIRRHADRLVWRSASDEGAYDAMNSAIELARGEWVMYMNAGDTFASDDALRRMFACVPKGVEVVYGHHIYKREDGSEELHRAAEFESTWRRLKSGDLWFDWLAGIPGHQATAIRRELLSRLRFDTRYHIAADHELLFRARAEGASFFNCDEVVAIYAAGGFSAQQYSQCRTQWAAIARSFGPETAVDRFYAQLETASKMTLPSSGSRLRHIVMSVILALDRYSPPLARAAERIVRSSVTKRVVRKLLSSALLPAIEPDYLYHADLEQGIDFRQNYLSDLLMSADGISQHPEPWGRRTDSSTVTLRFREPLPECFELVLTAHAFGCNARRSILIGIGRKWSKLQIRGEPADTYRIRLTNPLMADRIIFEIPAPTQSSRLIARQSRASGLALIQLRILTGASGPDNVI
jgi:GT2 family glycosyltransferase